MLTIATAADCSPFLEVVDRPALLVPGVAVRPLRRAEAAPVFEVFAGMSADSRRLRFLTAVPVLTDSMLERLTDVDHDGHGCWVATVGTEAVGLGRYVRMTDRPATAEIALDVVDRYQGLGLGRLLLEVVGAAAADAGITSLYWVMDPSNIRVRHLAVPLGGRFTRDDDVLEGTTGLPDVDSMDAIRVARVARAARRRVATAARGEHGVDDPTARPPVETRGEVA
jgi:GNAT superfamily N-acetyltransferase